MNTPELEALRAVRQHVYTVCGCRRDARCELLDAVLTAPSLQTPAHRSLVPTGQRGWGRLSEARNAGPRALGHLERLVASSALANEPAWSAVDASVWPRGEAATRPERGEEAHPSRPSHGQPIVAGGTSSWLVQVPHRGSRWTAPRRMRRVRPGEHLNLVAAAPSRSWRRPAPPAPPPSAPPPLFSFDAGSDAVQLGLALAHEPVGRLVRWRAGRGCSADPTSQPTTGRPRRQGTQFVGSDPPTGPAPTDQWSTADPPDGPVQLPAWSGLHPLPPQQPHAQRGTRRPRPLLGRGTLLRLEVEHLPRPTQAPEPLWFWWWGPGPPDLAVVWQADVARFAIAQTCRCFKPTLQWTTPKRRWPEAADRWTWRRRLLASVQVRWARDQRADGRWPWQRPLPPARRTPARVRRGFAQLLAALGSPVNGPQPGGRSPGRPKGQRSRPATRVPAIKLTP